MVAGLAPPLIVKRVEVNPPFTVAPPLISTRPVYVDTPATFKLSNSVCPSTSMSAPISRVEKIDVAVVSIPATLPPLLDAVTVTIPDEIAAVSYTHLTLPTKA